MSLAQRFERRLEGLVGGAFARVFKGQVEPVEIAGALQREAADKRNVVGGATGQGSVLCPNRYRVTLSPSDHDRLVPWESQLTGSLAELVQEYLDENEWGTIGDIEVYLARDDELHTGVFGVASRMEPGAPPRQRPHDSLSLPVVPGLEASAYGGAPQPAAAYAEPGYADQSYAEPGYSAQGYADRGEAGYGHNPYAPPPAYAPPPSFAAPPPHAAYQPPPTRPQSVAMLIVDQSNRRFDLRRGSNTIGRGTDSDLQLLDQGISRRHVDIQFDGDVATAHDLGSTNGTSVNGHEISSQPLRHGDVIRVGHTRIVFHQSAQGR